MPVTNVAHHRHEALVWRNNAACAEHRFHDKCSDRVGALEADFSIQQIGAELRQAGRIGFVERIAIAPGRCDVKTAR